MSHQKIYRFWYRLVNDDVPSSTSQIVKQIEDIQGGDIPGVSKMNDSAPDNKERLYENERYLMLPIIFAITSVDGSCDRVIDSSILKCFFVLDLSQNDHRTMQKKH